MGKDTISTGALPHEDRLTPTLQSLIHSDLLPELLKLAASWPGCALLLKDIVRIEMVIDANVVQGELRWRLRRRQAPSARTALHEAIAAGIIVPFAPRFLDDEIEEHVDRIARATKTSAEAVRREWREFRGLVHFYSPRQAQQSRPHCPVVDPDDLPYVAVAIELGVPVYSMDRHYRRMNTPVISVRIDASLRSYARASAFRVAVTLGSTFTVMLSCGLVHVVCRALRGAARWFAQLPREVQFAFIAAVIIAIADPRVRAKLGGVWQWTRGVAGPAVLNAMSAGALQLTTAGQATSVARQQFESALPERPNRTALMQMRAVCATARAPLALSEIERRIRAAGYQSRAKDLRKYLRRVLATSDQFSEVAPGIWALDGGSYSGSTVINSPQ